MTTQARYDIYAFIHKGLRGAMCQSLQALSSVDALDDDEFDQIAGQVSSLLRICQSHVEHENGFVHQAMEARRPGSSRGIAAQHLDHERHIRHLEEELRRIQHLPSLRRAESLHAYYREFAFWVADNFVHMEQEESEHNAVLWACYSDAEIQAIEQELVAHIKPEIMPLIQAHMLSAMTPGERGRFLNAVRPHLPAADFHGLLQRLQGLLSRPHYGKLLAAIQEPALSLPA